MARIVPIETQSGLLFIVASHVVWIRDNTTDPNADLGMPKTTLCGVDGSYHFTETPADEVIKALSGEA